MPSPSASTLDTVSVLLAVPTLIVLVGLPGAGKSTYAAHLLLTREELQGALVLSTDDIRWTFGSVYISAAEPHVWGIIEHFARGCLLHGRSVVIDGTNLTRSRRAELKEYAVQCHARAECHYLQCPKDESASRSTKHISARDIERLAGRLDPPSGDEGFHRLVIVPDWRREKKQTT